MKYELTTESPLLHRTHGMSKTSVYRTWSHIKDRCYRENDKSYKDYGARGIAVCDEWKNSFQQFYEHVSALPHFGEIGYTLDRINNDGNYEPGNVRWATKKTQNNNRRNMRLLAYNGKSQTLTEWSKELGVDVKLLWQRIYRQNMTVEEAFSLKKYEQRKKVDL